MSAMTQNAWIELRNAKMLEWMAGNQEAVEAVHTITEICDVWDDLVDRDKPVPEDAINGAFVKAFIALAGNSFYKRHEAQFFAILATGINAWLDSNTLQHGKTEKERMLAFYIRTFGFEVAHLAALLSGGWDHLRRVSLEMRMFFETETYAEWEHRYGME